MKIIIFLLIFGSQSIYSFLSHLLIIMAQIVYQSGGYGVTGFLL